LRSDTPSTGIKRLQSWAKKLKNHSLVVYYVARDPRTPIYVRVLAALIGAYALSPIDLIPDFIPVIGYLDDLILVPLGIALVIRLTPREIIQSAKQRAQLASQTPNSVFGAVCIVLIWLLFILLFARFLWQLADT
jgi:uncharacterized membrane protein YkvA (DUF1232 family)